MAQGLSIAVNLNPEEACRLITLVDQHCRQTTTAQGGKTEGSSFLGFAAIEFSSARAGKHDFSISVTVNVEGERLKEKFPETYQALLPLLGLA